MFALEFVLIAVWRVYCKISNVVRVEIRLKFLSSDITINRRRAAKLDARGVSAEERVRLGSLKGETDVTDLRKWIVVQY
jgi:hypothetical protein